MEFIIGLILLTAPLWLFVAYFLPGVIVSWRRADNQLAIWFLTLLTGWTVIGWVACFIWGCVSPKKVFKPLNQQPESFTGSIPQI